MARRPRSDQHSAQPPADAAAGAALIRAAAVKLYDRQDGTGADWCMVTDALFRAAFDALDKLPDDACRSVARRVHEGAYGRVTEGPRLPVSASHGGPSCEEISPSNTTTLKSTEPGGGQRAFPNS